MRSLKLYEKQIPTCLQRYLTALNPVIPGMIIIELGCEESNTGADGLLDIDGFMPFYMQYKKPSIFSYSSKRLSRILNDRLSLNIGDDQHSEIYYFKLRKKGKRQTECQHNVLYKTMKKKYFAAYVCPLFTELNNYILAMDNISIIKDVVNQSMPWALRDIEINIDNLTEPLNFTNIPFFPRHVSIPPHDALPLDEQPEKHCYSFRTDGSNVCFHKPELIYKEPQLFSNWLEKVYQEFIFPSEKVDNIIFPENATDKLRELMDDIKIPPKQQKRLLGRKEYSKELPGFLETTYELDKLVPEERGVFDSWRDFGRVLKANFGIHQYAFAKLKDAKLLK